MKRKILNSLLGVAMLGTAVSANAFLVPVQGHVVSNPVVDNFKITNMGGAAGFNETLTLRPGDSVNFSGFGGLAGMSVGDSLYANKLYVNGALAYDYNGVPGFQPGDIAGFFNQLAFSGDVTTLVTSGGIIPASITSASTGLSGSFQTNYTGTFSTFPGVTGAVVSSLLQAGTPISGRLDLSYSVTAGVLSMSLTDSNLSAGWGGFEGVFSALDSALFGGNNDGKIDGKLYLSATPQLQGNFVVSTVPEPASLALLGLGIAGLAFMRRRTA